MLSCKDGPNGTQVHQYYPEITCWVGLHILHAAFAGVSSLVFIFISLVVTLTFYETKSLTTNAGARYSNYFLNKLE